MLLDEGFLLAGVCSSATPSYSKSKAFYTYSGVYLLQQCTLGNLGANYTGAIISFFFFSDLPTEIKAKSQESKKF